MECGSYRAIKLLEHSMKLIELVFERRIRHKVVYTVFVLRQMQENLRNKAKALYYLCRP